MLLRRARAAPLPQFNQLELARADRFVSIAGRSPRLPGVGYQQTPMPLAMIANACTGAA
ncbi:MAG: hypothetical protein ACR2N4_17725 [Jatrophihabitans sp.]